MTEPMLPTIISVEADQVAEQSVSPVHKDRDQDACALILASIAAHGSETPSDVHLIHRLETEILKIPPVDTPVRHHFAPGVYAREMMIDAGTVVTGKVHKHPNISIIALGRVSILTDRGVVTVDAPYVYVAPAGTKRAVYAHTNVIWINVHGTNETDLEAIEKEFVAQDYLGFLEFCKTSDVEGD